jgi:hypothetical protein
MASAIVDSLIAALVASVTGVLAATYTFSNIRTAASDADVAHLLGTHNKTIVTAN